ncbi:MAG: hypothetical protein Q9182_000361 [Xanthomendoza sp. 2 TL-2023]
MPEARSYSQQADTNINLFSPAFIPSTKEKAAMGVDQVPEQSQPISKTVTKPSPHARARSKGTTTPVKAPLSKEWEVIDDELSIMSPQALNTPKAASRKRKQPSPTKMKSQLQDSSDTLNPTPKKRKTASPKKKDEEKRLRHFRTHAPASYKQKLERAQSQRMFIISRTRPSPLTETVSLAGTTGNIYTITISHLPHCTCPDSLKGNNNNQCKHIIYILHHVLKAPPHLQYQLAFLTPELDLIFSHAPLLDPPCNTTTTTPASNRKPITGDCPICFLEFDPATEEIVYCKAACGNNIHKHCFDTWARCAQQQQADVKCVYCRTPWQRDASNLEAVVAAASTELVGGEGYVNIAQELGLSGRRDVSSYHPFWVEKMRRGWGGGDFEDFED